MRRTLPMLTLLIMALAQPAQANWWDDGEKIRGNGDVQRVERETREIEAVELATVGTLFIEQGSTLKLEVEAEENLHEYIQTDVRRGTLVIRTQRGYQLRPRREIRYYLTVPQLEEVTISSSGDAVVSDWSADRLLINIESSGDMEWGAITCPDLDIRIESSGDLYIDHWEGEKLRALLGSSGDLHIGGGKTVEQDVEIHSSGDYEASKLASETATVRTSSSGDAMVMVSDYLFARTSSSGDIVYYGRPEVDGRSSSSGDIVRGGR